MATNSERRAVAAGLRNLAAVTAYIHLVSSNLDSLLFGIAFDGVDWDINDRNPDGLFINRLADLIEPEERTCYIEHVDEDSFHLSCGHEAAGRVSPSFCPSCGAEVVE